jgi:hypothetical protein
LLNQPGVTGGNSFGYAGSGFDHLTLSDTASSSIQTTSEAAGVAFSGTYQAAGTLADINGSPANGTWTLYFADLANGGGQATLTGWSLDITAVPEPVVPAMGIFVVSLLAVAGIRRVRQTMNRQS